jgi:hypothetical protein
VTLCLFGYHLFSTYTMNARIDRLEEILRSDSRGRTPTREDLLSFSWEGILDDMDRNQSLLPGDVLKIAPGVALIAIPDYSLFLTISANFLRHCIRDDAAGALFLSPTFGEREIGRALLTLESGKDWGALPVEEREKIADSMADAVGAYEERLFQQTGMKSTPHQVYEFCLGILEREDLRLVVGEEGALYEPDRDTPGGIAEMLRIIALRCSLPIVIFAFTGDERSLWHARESLASEISLLARVEAGDGKISVRVEKSPFQEKDSTLTLERPSGALVSASQTGI